ncbi:unnamed protein product [Psylliodes chrysocephalus]|uniref:Uncharacterized protein n=1 Tax=Psylliodes chrysocephalus TaxID=3402493 RepID=A0A9P0CXK8_9CUCU|nr:unnamed protein product [Psylliodes chrysocephala]
MLYIIWMVTLFENVSSEVLHDTKEIEYKSNKFSIGFHLLLPVAGLGLLILGRRHIFDKILLQLDRKYLTVLCPCFIKRENILKWACGRLPPTWSSHSVHTLSGGIKELWSDGSLLCTLINTGVPGACPNPHRHWRQTPAHAQTLAYKYFGIVQTFSSDELNLKLTSGLERKFIRYLGEIQQAVNKICENEDKDWKISSRYIVRGMGLFSGEQHKKTVFYIYLNENYEEDEDKDGSIIIQIKGPYGTYGEVMAPKLVNKKRKLIRNKRKQERRSSIQFIENLMQSNAWNFSRSQRKNINNGILIETTMEKDRIKVTYVPKNYGMYEINMFTAGEILNGCPFSVHIFINELPVAENEKCEKESNNRKPVKITKTHVLPNLLENDETKLKSDLKSTFNFQEVVDEITKNGTVYRNILGHTPETETANLEILATNNEINVTDKNLGCSDDRNYLKSSDRNWLKPDHDIDINFKKSAEKKLTEVIKITNNNPTKDDGQLLNADQNVPNEVVNEPKPLENEPDETIKSCNTDKQIFKNKNYDNASKQEASNKIKINNMNSASIFASNNLINHNEKTQSNFVLEPKYVNAVNVNKIKIPDMFNEDSLKQPSYRLEDKYFKNILNESSKKSNIELNKDNYNNNNIERSKNKYIDEIYKPELDNYSKLLEEDTSPICPYHIVPEVEIIPRTVAEKRKIFARGSLRSKFGSNRKVSSFLDENEQESTDRESQPAGQNVLNIVNNLKGSASESPTPTEPLTETWSLCSTFSLPNLSLDSDCSYTVSIKDRKSFWENLSSGSSSSSTKSLYPSKMEDPTDLVRSKMIWRKPLSNFRPAENVYKSADDILSMATSHAEYVKCNSVEDSLDKCAVLSIEDRKRLLLKQFYEKENINRGQQRKRIIIKHEITSADDDEKRKKETVEANQIDCFTSISEKIKKYNSDNFKLVETVRIYQKNG